MVKIKEYSLMQHTKHFKIHRCIVLNDFFCLKKGNKNHVSQRAVEDWIFKIPVRAVPA